MNKWEFLIAFYQNIVNAMLLRLANMCLGMQSQQKRLYDAFKLDYNYIVKILLKEWDYNMLYTIYMPWLARGLQERGFKMVRVAESKKKPGLAVYQFIDSPELQIAIREIVNEKKHR